MAMDSAKRGEIMELAKQQIAVANAQEMLSKMTQRCFKKCVGKPGYSLDSSEQKCISMCMDRFMDSWDLISRAYDQRIQRQQHNQ